MANDVFANGMEIACKAGAGKVIAAFPDVCMTPPENPATPPGVPVPYPDTAMASDTTKGSKKVKISNKEIMLKNKSYFKTLSGNEAGCAAKKGVVSSKIKGKVYFVKWSMDVKVEGENVDRHLDLTTNNHGSPQANEAAPWPFTDSMTAAQIKACENDKKREEEACSEDGVSRGKDTKYKGAKECCNDEKCQNARKCMLVPYKHNSKKTCCSGQTGHHLVEVHGFMSNRKAGINLPQFPNYNENDAPCVCAKCPRGSRFKQEHGDLHAVQGVLELGAMSRAPANMKKMAWNYGEARTAGVQAHAATFPDSNCNPDCIAAQLNNYHQSPSQNISDNTPLKTGPGSLGVNPTSQWQRGIELLESLARRMGQMTSV